MTDPDSRARWSAPALRARLARRHAAERRFRRLGAAAIVTAMASLALLLASIVWNGHGAFRAAEIRLDIAFPEAAFDAADPRDPVAFETALARADTAALLRDALRALFPEAQSRRDVRALQALVSSGARGALRDALRADPSLLGRSASLWLPADDEVDLFLRGRIARQTPEAERRLSDLQIAWIEQLEAAQRLRRHWNTRFFTSGDSREPELAGVWGAAVGSFLTLLVALGLVFPVGVAAAIYLEEFAPRTRWTDVVEVNINNLAAVPSIVFGLLGLAVFLNTFQLPRSAPLVGGMTLALMTLPTIIITGRAAIQAVPPSIREAARGIGASPVQVVGTTCSHSPCRASSRERSSAWRGRSGRRRRC